VGCASVSQHASPCAIATRYSLVRIATIVPAAGSTITIVLRSNMVCIHAVRMPPKSTTCSPMQLSLCSLALMRLPRSLVQHDPEGRPVPTHYLILEYCDGGDLAEFLDSRRRSGSRGIDEPTARRLLRMLAMGLHEMHARHIVHVRAPPRLRSLRQRMCLLRE
jgi:serine/threonine protein kinase